MNQTDTRQTKRRKLYYVCTQESQEKGNEDSKKQLDLWTYISF